MTATPTVSILMATYNGARTIRASIESVLSQTLRDFELIVVDDCSTDATPDILRAIGDERLRVVRNDRNLNVVGSRNLALSLARGRLIALLDHDDLSLPTRLARQVAYLDAHPGTVLLGTATRVLQDGRMRPMMHPAETTPAVIEWLLKLSNPLVCSSVMFRAEASRRLDAFMREDFRYADDFDLYHRMSALGTVARLDDVLTIYRLHASNTFKEHETTMTANAAKVLVPSYRAMFGAEAEATAELMVRCLSAGSPVPDEASLARIGAAYSAITRPYLDAASMDETTRRVVRRHGAVLWRRVLHAAAAGSTTPWTHLRRAVPAEVGLSAVELNQIALRRLPLRKTGRRLVGQMLRPKEATRWAPPAVEYQGTRYEPVLPEPDAAPTMFVVVDTEAEFDWTQPFRRDLISVTAMDEIDRGQSIFDEYGLRPVYVVDYPVVSQARGYARLQSILERDGCAIGAHLHPWTTPPFDEALSTGNSFPGNLPAELEERKLGNLIQAITKVFGIRPVYYKAGRYGLGPQTHATLARHGIEVDFSILANADLRGLGGPDFRRFAPVPYRAGATGVVTVPMTRARVGLTPTLIPVAARINETRVGRRLHVPSVLARTRLADIVTLTPEHVTAEAQIRLLRTLLRQGVKTFVLHYHSPTLSAGHTKYAADEEGVQTILARLRRVCQFFFDEVGGLPGYPEDLKKMAGPRRLTPAASDPTEGS